MQLYGQEIEMTTVMKYYKINVQSWDKLMNKKWKKQCSVMCYF